MSVVKAYPIPASSGPAGPQAAAGDIAYCGISVRETTGTTAAVIRVRSGGAAGGTILDTFALAAGASATSTYGYQGVDAGMGVYVEIVSGAVEGSVKVR